METSTELREVVYGILLTQIQFGAYRCGEKLPTIEETSARLHVSVATARGAYLKLKEDGYISLTKNVGATVKADYDGQRTERFIQTFFSSRKKAMIDLGNSLRPLFGNAQWVGLKNSSEETRRAMERLWREGNATLPYAMLEHLNLKYRALGNSLLMRLVWQTFMFLHDPYFSIKENLRYFDQADGYLPTVLALCRKQDWPALRGEIDRSIDRLFLALTRFYEARIPAAPPEREVAFTWSSFKKSRQLCYTFAMELLISISRGVYPAGSLFPSQEELARQRGISVSTVRRSLELLGSVGAVKSQRYVGTRVLPPDQITENSDFTKPVLQRRLLDMAESLQILALSCKEVSQLTLASLDSGGLGRMLRALNANKAARRGSVLSYFVLDQIARYAPYQAIRCVYSELLRQFFWAYPLRGAEGSQETVNASYDPYSDVLIEALEERDFPRFAASLEELLVYDLRRTVNSLSRLGVPGVERLWIPG